jgi:transcriptional regulator with XRE-family HTH domain
MVHRARAVGKCQNQVPYSCAIGIIPPDGICDISPKDSHTGRKRPRVPEVHSPTLRRRELGVRLRALRLEQGLTVEQVAELLLCSPSKVSRMETGQRGATARDIRDLCGIYGVIDGAQVAHMMELAKEGKQQGWWQSHDLDFAPYVDLEQAAAATSYFQSTLVPGLLQTVDYMRGMYAGGLPGEFTPERTDELMKVRFRRQEILTRDPPLPLHTILDEAVLHRVVGSPSTMSAQLQHLNVVANLPSVTLQVLPYAAGAHPAMDSMFNILEFDVVPPVVYVEGLMGMLYIERESEVARYRQVFEFLRSIALNPQETIALVSEIAAGYGSAD